MPGNINEQKIARKTYEQSAIYFADYYNALAQAQKENPIALADEMINIFNAISEVAKAADAAAVAASAEINQRTFRDKWIVISQWQDLVECQSYVAKNSDGLAAKGVHAYVTGIQVSGGENMVRVDVSANLSILFPSVVPNVTVTQTGVAKLRAFTH